MKKYLNYIIAILLAAAVTGCKSYAKFTIDKDPKIKTDSMLLGSWKAVEDTDKQNFIFIQSPYGIFNGERQWHNMDSGSRRKYLEEEYPNDTKRQNLYMGYDGFNEDSVYHYYYKRFIKENGWYYYVTYFNRHGKNPLYGQWDTYLSEVNGKRFLTFNYRYSPDVYGGPPNSKQVEGYFYVRIVSMNATYDTLTVSVVADSILKYIKTSGEIRERIAKNADNPAFYSDTVHFYKVNGYHASMDEAVKRAN